MTSRFCDQLLNLFDKALCRGCFIAANVVEPDITKGALLPVAAMRNRELVPVAFRPQAVHRVCGIKNRQIAIQLQSTIGRTSDLAHGEVRRAWIIREDDSIIFSIERSTESLA